MEPNLPIAREPAADRGKFGFTYLRFTILFALLALASSTIPVWMSFLVRTSAPVRIIVVSVLVGIEVAISLFALSRTRMMGWEPVPQWDDTFDVRRRTFKHVVVIACDPNVVLWQLHASLDSLCFQLCPENLVVVVSFDSWEVSDEDLSLRRESVRKVYSDKFGDFLILSYNWKHLTEVRGSSSNKNFALREAYRFCHRDHGIMFRLSRYTVTTLPWGAKLHPRYFEVLQSMYNAAHPTLDGTVHHFIWQPAVCHVGRNNAGSLLSTLWVMATRRELGVWVPLSLHASHVMSFPLETGSEGGFMNPRYAADDLLMVVKWMCELREPIRVQLLPLPVLGAPPVEWDSAGMKECVRRIRYQAWGAADAFHYFLVHWRGRPFLAGLWWIVWEVVVYAMLHYSTGVAVVLCIIPLPWRNADPLFNVDDTPVNHAVVATGIAYVGMLMVGWLSFILDAWLLEHVGLEDRTSPVTSFVRLMVSPVVMVVESIVGLVALAEFVVRGRPRQQAHVAKSPRGKSTAKVEHTHNDVVHRLQARSVDLMQNSESFSNVIRVALTEGGR